LALCLGACQGVIALNMEDGTLHRFSAKSTILATGVFMIAIFHFPNLQSFDFSLVSLFSFSVFNRDMVGLISLQPLPIHVPEMGMQWLHVLGFHCRFALEFHHYQVQILGSCDILDTPWFLICCNSTVLLQDLEFVQFHPTGIYGVGCLITEGTFFSL